MMRDAMSCNFTTIDVLPAFGTDTLATVDLVLVQFESVAAKFDEVVGTYPMAFDAVESDV